MDFLVEFEINVPGGTPESEVTAREEAESAAAAKLVDQGHLVSRLFNLFAVRVWVGHAYSHCCSNRVVG
jgi:hypothetical protein